MENFIIMVDELSNSGIPIVITAGVFYLVARIFKNAPKYIERYFEFVSEREERKETEEKRLQTQYEEQMKVIITVAQQGVEAQRRGNEIIGRNNIIIEGKIKTDERLADAINMLNDTTSRLDESVSCNTSVVQQTYTEIIRVGASLK